MTGFSPPEVRPPDLPRIRVQRPGPVGPQPGSSHSGPARRFTEPHPRGLFLVFYKAVRGSLSGSCPPTPVRRYPDPTLWGVPENRAQEGRDCFSNLRESPPDQLVGRSHRSIRAFPEGWRLGNRCRQGVSPSKSERPLERQAKLRLVDLASCGEQGNVGKVPHPSVRPAPLISGWSKSGWISKNMESPRSRRPAA